MITADRYTIYQFFDDPQKMTASQKQCYEDSLSVFRVPAVLVTSESLLDYEVKDHPIHKAYHLLSPDHKSDYARCYLLRFYGGGYADIRKYGTDNNWKEQFDLLFSTPYADIIGTPENERLAAFDSYRDYYHTSRLIITQYMIAKKDTPFTRMWYSHVSNYLDFMFQTLNKFSYKSSGSNSDYPIPRFGIMGFPFHYTCLVASKIRPNSVLRSLRSGRM